MKMSVITSHYIFNYGSVLQTYATRLFFEQMGYEVEFVNYIRENVRNGNVANSKWESNGLKKFIYKIYRKVDTAKKRNIFGRYILEHVCLSDEFASKDELYRNPPAADVYCVGSDQMWNSEYNGGLLAETFLDYAPSGSKKISFSSSMGMSRYSAKELCQMKEYLSDFSFISVREKEAVRILSDAGVKDVHLVLDPTLLIPADIWKKEMTRKMHKKKYVLLYQLNENPRMLDFVIKLANRKHLEIISIAYSMLKMHKGIHFIYCPQVCEFLSLFYYAEYIVTDSFHGTAFSINLNKDFYAFCPPRYSSRIQSVLNVMGLDDRLVSETREMNLERSIDYNIVNEILEKERESVKNMFTGIVNVKAYE